MSVQLASLTSLDQLTPESMARIQREVDSLIKSESKNSFWKNLCNNGTDEEILAAASKEFADDNVPIVLASAYPAGTYLPYTEIVARYVGYHPRRPVIMRGARGAMICHYSRSLGHSSPNGYAAKVFDRWVKKAKITALSREEWREKTAYMLKEANRRFCLSYHFHQMIREVPHQLIWQEDFEVIVGGRFVYINAAELRNIKALRAIVQKTDDLDKRREMARVHFQERMQQ